MDKPLQLDESANKFDSSNDFDAVMAYYDVRKITTWLHADSILELGSSAGTVTRYLYEKSSTLDVVEGSGVAIERSQSKLNDYSISLDKINFIHGLWETYTPNDKSKKYSDIVFIRGLEHVSDRMRDSLLNHLRDLVVSKGRIHIIVPNALSLHRHIMVRQGKLSNLYEMRDRDFMVGHEVIFDKSRLEKEVKDSGWNILHSETFFVKPISTSEMGCITSDPHHVLVKACYDSSEFIPELGTQIYLVAERPL